MQASDLQGLACMRKTTFVVGLPCARPPPLLVHGAGRERTASSAPDHERQQVAERRGAGYDSFRRLCARYGVLFAPDELGFWPRKRVRCLGLAKVQRACRRLSSSRTNCVCFEGLFGVQTAFARLQRLCYLQESLGTHDLLGPYCDQLDQAPSAGKWLAGTCYIPEIAAWSLVCDIQAVNAVF